MYMHIYICIHRNWSFLLWPHLYSPISQIGWCCFYYFVRNSLVTWLEALCARIFFRFENIGFADIFLCVCARSLSFPFSKPARSLSFCFFFWKKSNQRINFFFGTTLGLESFDSGKCISTHPCWYKKKDSNIICNVNAKTREINIITYTITNRHCSLRLIWLNCVCFLMKQIFRPSQPGSCTWLSLFLLCADHTCVLVCVRVLFAFPPPYFIFGIMCVGVRVVPNSSPNCVDRTRVWHLELALITRTFAPIQ